MDVSKISMNSPVTFAFICALVAGAFGLYSFVSPTFAQVTTNKFEIDSQKERIEKVETSQEKYHEHILNISNSLSEIEGRLRAMTEREYQEERSVIRKGRKR